jgi:DNA oxidative demethylase
VDQLTLPEGLVYEAEFVDEDEQQELLAEISSLEFDEIRMHGQVARRSAKH